MSNNPNEDLKILQAIAQSQLTHLQGALLFDDFYPNETLLYWTDKTQTQYKSVKPIDYALQTQQDKAALFLLKNGAQITFQNAVNLLMLAKETENIQLAELVAQKLPTVLISYRNQTIVQKLMREKERNSSFKTL